MLLLLAFYLLTFALLADLLLVHDLTLAITVRTLHTSLGVHARTKLLHLHDCSLPITRPTLTHSRRVAASNSIALCTEALAIDFNLELVAIVHLFKSHFYFLYYRFNLLLLLLASATASKHLREDVSHATSSISFTVNSIFTILVVGLTLLRIA